MARQISYVPTAPDRGSVAVLPVDAIPADVIAEVEEVYAALKANPNGRMRATFDSKEELHQYMTQVVSYCAQRAVEGIATPLRFRKSPTKNLPDNIMDYRIGDPIAAKDEAQTTAETVATSEVATAEEPSTKATPAKPKVGRK
jgi:hypothetical protein